MTPGKVQFLKLTELSQDPKNARTHSPEQMEMIAASVRRFGWTTPVLVADGVIYAGNGRYAAAQMIYAGGDEIYLAPGKERGGRKISRGTIPAIDCTGWSAEERAAIALADNQIALQAGWDETRLMESLDALAAIDFPLEVIGFDEGAIAALSLPPGNGGGGRMIDPTGESDYRHVDQFGVIVICVSEAEQEEIFTRLRDEGLNVKVVVV